MRLFTALLVFVLIVGCKQDFSETLKPGSYRVMMDLSDNQVLPFNISVKEGSVINIYNGKEVITTDLVTFFNDSIKINFPVYEGYIVGAYKNGNITDAKYIKESLNRIVPVRFMYGENNRFIDRLEPKVDVTGEWEMNFIEEDGSSYTGKGIFEQVEHGILRGTIRTTTGDYRYLDGVTSKDKIKLSTFDGAHAFLFTGNVKDSVLEGTFYSGNHYKANFTATRNDNYELPDANSLTYLKEGYDKVEFSFPDENGTMVSLEDERFKDKVVLVQIMGTWCPNCLDESRFYSEYYQEHANEDLEIIALAFEYAKTEERAINNIKRLREHTGITYPILLAQVGTSSKSKANEKLPMLNHVLSYPTTLFIDKKGEARKIHTGFNGPATGKKYTEFVTEFESFVDQLLKE
ncbi:redoxin domain-containing protein [Winogradskyella sp. 3972H.M.0a.05]|uniref:TlpA disulfide reductase family protein n=1 Tax=Winogradskyella sp. 3972H.M.0a.05 TaxID=2950277 RepID=UPI003396F3E7